MPPWISECFTHLRNRLRLPPGKKKDEEIVLIEKQQVRSGAWLRRYTGKGGIQKVIKNCQYKEHGDTDVAAVTRAPQFARG